MNCFIKNNLISLPPKGENIYLIGAGGCGMSALGHILLDLGYRVSGSDMQLNKNILQLKERGAKIFQGHNEKNIDETKPVLVIYSSAISPDNPELRRARQLNIYPIKRGAFLSDIVNETNLVSVAGMHGKTTTTSMLAYGFELFGCCGGYAIGWNVPQLKRHGKINCESLKNNLQQRNYFVIEADESDGTLNFYNPQHLIVLNIDHEHMDYFGSFESVKNEFLSLMERTRGNVVYCADDEILSQIIVKKQNYYSYGINELADYRIVMKCVDADGQTFDVFKKSELFGAFTSKLMGFHNVLNSTAVITLLDLIGIGKKEIWQLINSFRGAERRQEELFNDGKIRVIDDYGHHPTEIRATVKAIRRFKRLIVVFQPHRFTRTRDLQVEFGRCFEGADSVIVMDIYGAGEKPIPGVSSQLIVNQILKNGIPSEFVPDEKSVCEKVLKNLTDGDVVLFCGAGANVTELAHKVAAILSKKENNANETADCSAITVRTRDSR